MKGKIFAMFAVFVMIFMGFTAIGAQAKNTNVKLTTDANTYDVGLPVTFTVENNGDVFHCNHWKVTIWNAATGEYVYYKGEDPDGPWTCLDMIVGNGATFTWTWDQKYFVMTYRLTHHTTGDVKLDREGNVISIGDITMLEPTWEMPEPTWEPVYGGQNGNQVPEGVYRARADFMGTTNVIASSNIVTFTIGTPGGSHIPENQGTAHNPNL